MISDARQIHRTLAKSSVPRIETEYEDGLARGQKCPVIIILDIEDPLGRRIAEDWVGRDEVSVNIEALQGGRRPGVTTTMVVAVEFDKLRAIARIRPELRQRFSIAPPAGEILVLVVAAGGMTSALMERRDSTKASR